MSKRKADSRGTTPPSADEDAALAELLALLDPAPFSPDACVRALRRADGDVARAAELLLVGGEMGESSSASASGSQTTLASSQASVPSQCSSRAGSGSRKRPRQGGLAQWFKTPKKGDAAPAEAFLSASSPVLDAPEAVDREVSAANWAALLSRPPAKEVKTEKSRAAPQRATYLATPAAVAASGLPLVLLPSPLDPAFAAGLFHEMLHESTKWGRNKFFLAGREVESNHQATSYARDGSESSFSEGGTYYYNGAKYSAKTYTPFLARTAQLVEDAVNAHLETVPRYPLEYRGRWRANVCAANRYDGAQATVGFHSDQMTYLGPYPTIASLSLGTPRAFRLRAVAAADSAYAGDEPPRTYEVTLGHNSLVLMTPGCQERYKHTVPPQRALDVFRLGYDADGNALPPDKHETYTTRINITFRFYREDFRPEPGTGPRGERWGTPKCKCGIPTCAFLLNLANTSLLRADQKAKARAQMGVAARTPGAVSNGVVDDDMVYFWQCQSPSMTGQLKGCGFFKILDMRGEGRGPCWGDPPACAGEVRTLGQGTPDAPDDNRGKSSIPPCVAAEADNAGDEAGEKG